MSASSLVKRRPLIWLVLVSLMMGYALMICPLPGRFIWVRPMWMILILVYWVVMFPDQFGLGVAWSTGFLLDLLNGSLLGEHALAMSIAIFMILRIHTRFRFFPLLQQSLAVFGVVFLYQAIIFCVQLSLKRSVDPWYWFGPFVSLLLWPWVFSLLHYCQCRFATA